MAFDAFISYSHRDRLAADAACAGLEAAGIRCWIAPRDIAPGKEWAEGIIFGIEQCRVMVLIFSADSNRSPQIRKEVERAVSKEKPILPFRIEDTLPDSKLEYFLGNVHWLDALTPPVTAHIGRLIEAVKSLLDVEPAGGGGKAIAVPPLFLRPHFLARRDWTLAGGATVIALAAALFFWTANPSQRARTAADGQVIALAEAVHADVTNGAWDDANKTLAALASLSPSSGHTLYFEGELQRIMRPNRDLYRAIDWFERYAEDPRNEQALASNRLDGQSCYESAEGFCRQRTGWVLHLLANIFYRMSQDASLAPDKRRKYLVAAGQYVRQSAKFYPPGFEAAVAAPGQLIDNARSTGELEALTRVQPK